MLKNLIGKNPALTTMVVFFAVLCSQYSHVLLSPNSCLFSADGDAIKNYYTFCYSVKYGYNGWDFNGMNYPYGEHFVFTDNNPLLVSFLHSLQKVFPVVNRYSVGVYNLSMLFSLLVACYFVFLILKKHNLSALYAGACSVAILTLAPQAARFAGHLSLSYACVIPITLYLNSNLLQRFSLRDYLFAFFNTLFWIFIHAYLGILVASFTFLIVLANWWRQGVTRHGASKQHLVAIMFSVAPVVLYYLFVKLTDHHINRSTNPYGYFEYYADFDTVFLPNHAPLKLVVDSLLPSFTQTWEGWSYIGLCSIVFIGFFVLNKALIYFKPKKSLAISIPGELLPFIFASIILLVFSFGFPFRYGLKSALDYFPVIKQFRSIGRFAWPFYFVINIVMVVVIYKLANSTANIKSRFLKNVIYVIPLVMIVEGAPLHVETAAKLSKSVNVFSEVNNPVLYNINQEKYQAILPLPFYCVGSENVEKIGTNSIYQHSMAMSYQCNLPVIGSCLTRNSISESRAIMQLFSPPIYNKIMDRNRFSAKPILLLYSKEELNTEEQDMLAKSKLIRDCGTYSLYEITPDVLFATSDNYPEANLQGLVNTSMSCSTNDTGGYLVYLDYNSTKCLKTHQGSGALAINKNSVTRLVSIPSNSLISGKEYTASVWICHADKNAGQDVLNNLEMNVVAGGIVLAGSKPMASLIVDGDWTRCEVVFRVERPDVPLEVQIKGIDGIDKQIVLDDFFLGRKDKVYRFSKPKIQIVNNHFIRQKKQ